MRRSEVEHISRKKRLERHPLNLPERRWCFGGTEILAK